MTDQELVFWIVAIGGSALISIPFGVVNEQVKAAAKRPEGPSRRLKRIRAALVVLGVMFAVVSFLGSGFTRTLAERRAVHRVLTPLSRGQFERAHARSSKRFQARTTPEDLETYLDDRVPDLLRSTSVWAYPMNGNGSMYCVALWLHGPVKESLVYALLAKERDAWKLDDLSESKPRFCEWVSSNRHPR